MEVLSEQPINDYVENLYQNGFPEFVDADGFLELSDELRELEDQLYEIVADETKVDKQKLRESYKALAKVLLLVMNLELLGGEKFEEDFSDDLEYEEFNVNDVYNFIEAARLSNDHIFLEKMISEALSVLESIGREEAIMELYYLLEDALGDLKKEAVVNADPEIVLSNMMEKIKEQHSEILNKEKEKHTKSVHGITSIIRGPWQNKD